MERYNIFITQDAENALKSIGDYITVSLRSPIAAINTLHALRNGIFALDFMPQRYAILPEDLSEKEGIRRMQVKNYFIYFNIDEKQKNVIIVDVIYVGMEQKEQLAMDAE